MIIGKHDPLYELQLAPSELSGELAQLHPFLCFASLDLILSNMWSINATFLKAQDKFNQTLISAYATQGGKILLLMHSQTKSEDAVRAFFLEVHEVYVKYLMNPFVEHDAPVSSPHFTAHVRQIAKKFLL